MELKICIEEGLTGGFSLVLRLGDDLHIGVQEGYATERDALVAFIEALTYAAPPPPDLAPYEAGLLALSELATGQEDIGSAITTLGSRMNDVEDKLEALDGPTQPAQTPGRRSLLPGREVARGPVEPLATPKQGPPPLRRPMTKDRRDVEEVLASRVHGQLFGGVSRRGGPTSDDSEG